MARIQPQQNPTMATLSNSSSNRIYTISCKPLSPSLLYLRRLCRAPRAGRKSSKPNGGLFLVRAYMEESASISGFASKLIGALPVVGLFARIISDEGGVGGDLIDFAEFRRRVGKKCSVNDSRAFYDFQDRHGKTGEPLNVLMCCWLAAVGAGLLKSEEILEGVARLRISEDIEFEEENFIAMMNEARERRAKSGSLSPTIPMEYRVEKALEAIYVCCFGGDPIEEEEDVADLSVMLNAVFPTIGQREMDRIVREKATRLAEGTDEIKIPEKNKPLPKEAVQLQMKDLQFLRDGGDAT
ncbi:photosystem I assembly factor PSA3, chloroplastic [Henckelia pumila]|uniref:photosystem I assembly factor PSA3, chloroplastic n=1 Tax=Henckelia pumila TaxID=405737 RepID=UPI003C6DDFFF